MTSEIHGIYAGAGTDPCFLKTDFTTMTCVDGMPKSRYFNNSHSFLSKYTDENIDDVWIELLYKEYKRFGFRVFKHDIDNCIITFKNKKLNGKKYKKEKKYRKYEINESTDNKTVYYYYNMKIEKFIKKYKGVKTYNMLYVSGYVPPSKIKKHMQIPFKIYFCETTVFGICMDIKNVSSWAVIHDDGADHLPFYNGDEDIYNLSFTEFIEEYDMRNECPDDTSTESTTESS